VRRGPGCKVVEVEVAVRDGLGKVRLELRLLLIAHEGTSRKLSVVVAQALVQMFQTADLLPQREVLGAQASRFGELLLEALDALSLLRLPVAVAD
jgi:hypothetical protein